MVYIKNNTTIYPILQELRIETKTSVHLCIGDKSITSSHDLKQIQFYFTEIQRLIGEGHLMINLNEIISSYTKG